jgi:hypothetical protein
MTKLIFIFALFNICCCQYYHYSNPEAGISLYFFKSFAFIKHPELSCPDNRYFNIDGQEKFCYFEYSKHWEANRLSEIKIQAETVDTKFTVGIFLNNQLSYFECSFTLKKTQQIEIFELMTMIYKEVKSFTFNLAYITENKLPTEINENIGYELIFSPEAIFYTPMIDKINIPEQISKNFKLESKEAKKTYFLNIFTKPYHKEETESGTKAKPKVTFAKDTKEVDSAKNSHLSENRYKLKIERLRQIIIKKHGEANYIF